MKLNNQKRINFINIPIHKKMNLVVQNKLLKSFTLPVILNYFLGVQPPESLLINFAFF
jgi:hypothetical protein